MSEEITFTLPEPTILLNKLLRMHWRVRRRHIEALAWQVRSQLRGIQEMELRVPLQKCRIEVKRYSSGTLPDWDGLYGGLKPLLDCLVVRTRRNPHGLGLIEDDNPSVVVDLRVVPVKCKRADQRTEVRIIPQRNTGLREMNIDDKMQRLTRWMLLTEQPEPLGLDHEVQKDIAWAADEILGLREAITNALQQQPYMATRATKICNELRTALLE